MQIDERTRTELASRTRFKDIRLLEVTDSTNRVVGELAAAGAREGLVVAADLQTAGRGRLDRSWEAAAGEALLVSVLLRAEGLRPSRWHLLTAAAALAGRRACEQIAGFVPELKWPNDLMVGERKLAGILAESTAESVVVGMGLNVHGGPPGAAWVDDLAGRRVGRAPLLAAWLRALDGLLGDFEGLAASYRKSCATVGQEVAVELSGGSVVGIAEGLDDEGRLLVHPEGSREPVAVAAGDVVHLRPSTREREAT